MKLLKFILPLFIFTALFTGCKDESVQSDKASFAQYFPVLLKFEGESFTAFDYDNDGGGTKYGLTFASFKVFAKQKKFQDIPFDYDFDGFITANDLRRTPVSTIKLIYKRAYWDFWLCDFIDNQTVAECLTDFLINSGAGYKQRHVLKIHKILDCHQVRKTPNFSSVVCINNNDTQEVVYSVCAYRWSFLKTLDIFPKVRKGWRKRIAYFSTIKTPQNNEKVTFDFLNS